MKRLFDIVFAGLALSLTWPLILVSAIAIKIDSPGPVLYKSRRAGRYSQPFYILKLRTMRIDSEKADRKITDAEDDRITRTGHWLRKLKIDELPQFWNVLRGDMSIVGPRPEDIDIVKQYYTPEQRIILEIRPGITSPTEVRWYPDLTYHDPPPKGVTIQEHYLERHLPAQVNEGLRYMERQSFFLDLKIVIQTFYCVLVHSWMPPKKALVSLEELNVQTLAKCRPEPHPER